MNSAHYSNDMCACFFTTSFVFYPATHTFIITAC